MYSWQGKVHLSGWEKNGPAVFFANQITICTRLMLYLVRVGKEWAGPVFPHPLKSNGCLHIHDRVRLILSLVGVGKEWASPVFLHPDNHLHKVDTFSCQGGERMGQPSFSPPPKKQRLYAYSWQGKVDTFTSQGGKRMIQRVFLHLDNHLHKVDALSCLGGERMRWPSFSPPPK